VSTHTAIPELFTQRAKFDPWGKSRAETDEIKALQAKVDEEARENWDNPEWRRQLAADLVEQYDWGFYNGANLFNGYVDTEQVAEFDRVVIRDMRGMQVFSTARGGYIDESTIMDEVFEVPRDQTVGFHVTELEDNLRANFSNTIQHMVDKGNQRFDAEVNRQILTLSQAAVPSTAANYTASVGLTKAELDAAIRQVKDAIRPDGTGPVPITILGRAAMLDAISDFPGHSYQPVFADPALEEVRRNGYLGTYKGCNVVQVTNYADANGVPYTQANELWVMGGTAGKFVFYGNMVMRMWNENTTDVVHFRARKNMGALIYRPQLLHRVVDSSITP
jgi:hypothetical protein